MPSTCICFEHNFTKKICRLNDLFWVFAFSLMPPASLQEERPSLLPGFFGQWCLDRCGGALAQPRFERPSVLFLPSQACCIATGGSTPHPGSCSLGKDQDHIKEYASWLELNLAAYEQSEAKTKHVLIHLPLYSPSPHFHPNWALTPILRYHAHSLAGPSGDRYSHICQKIKTLF